MDLKQLISRIRDGANIPTTNARRTDTQLTHAMNLDYQTVCTKIAEADEGYFEDDNTGLGFIKGQREYILPFGVKDQTITLIEQTDAMPRPDKMNNIPFQDREGFEIFAQNAIATSTSTFVYYLRGDKIGIVPTPGYTAASGNIRISYLRHPKDLCYGNCISGASTTVLISGTATVGTLEVNEAGGGFYAGERIKIISGTGAGQERVVIHPATGSTVQVGSDLMLHIDNAWSTIPDSTSVYSFLPAVPVNYHSLLVSYGILRHFEIDGDDRMITIWQRRVNEQMSTLLTAIEARRVDSPNFVSFNSTEDMNYY